MTILSSSGGQHYIVGFRSKHHKLHIVDFLRHAGFFGR